jgi:hypothetical protein
MALAWQSSVGLGLLETATVEEGDVLLLVRTSFSGIAKRGLWDTTHTDLSKQCPWPFARSLACVEQM